MRILIVSEFFAPVRSIGAIRWTKLAKYLAKDHDVQIDLLTNEKEYSLDQKPSAYFFDKSAAEEVAYLNQVITLPAPACAKAIDFIFDSAYKMLGGSNPNTEASSAANSSRLRRILSAAYKRAFSSTLSTLLAMKANSIAKSAKKIHINGSRYDAIISTSPPIWTHKIASKIKEANEGIFWIADYRDPSNDMADIPKRHKGDTVETYSRDADAVLTVWKNEPSIMRIPDTTKSVYIPNGYDPEEASRRERLPLDVFRISYTGSLVVTRDLTPLFKALTNLIDRGEIDANKIEINYAGSTSDAFQTMIDGFETLNRKDHGFLTRKDALALQDSSAMLVICTWNTETYKTGIGGKLFELLSSSIPVAGICSGTVPDSPLKRFLSTTDTGYCYEEANSEVDLKELEAYILRCYNEWQATGTTRTDPNRDELEKFRHDRLASHIHEMIEASVSHPAE